jgi:hypothetical protein
MRQTGWSCWPYERQPGCCQHRAPGIVLAGPVHGFHRLRVVLHHKRQRDDSQQRRPGCGRVPALCCCKRQSWTCDRVLLSISRPDGVYAFNSLTNRTHLSSVQCYPCSASVQSHCRCVCWCPYRRIAGALHTGHVHILVVLQDKYEVASFISLYQVVPQPVVRRVGPCPTSCSASHGTR